MLLLSHLFLNISNVCEACSSIATKRICFSSSDTFPTKVFSGTYTGLRLQYTWTDSIAQLAWPLTTEMLKPPAQAPDSSPDAGSGHTEAGATAFYCTGFTNWLDQSQLGCTCIATHNIGIATPSYLLLCWCLPTCAVQWPGRVGRVDCDFEGERRNKYFFSSEFSYT